MKFRYVLLVLLLASAAQAQTSDQQYPRLMPPAPQPVQAAPAIAPEVKALKELQDEWAQIKYQTPDHDSQEQAIEQLSKHAARIAKTYPASNEIKVWQAIILATKAGIDGGLGALGDAKAARVLLEQVEKAAPQTLDGSVYTSLGSLYYKVPGWPVGFGNDQKAKAYLQKALALNPDGIDPNFFYGDYEVEQGQYDLARPYLEKALQAPARPGRELADAGRRKEAKELLAKIGDKI